MMKNEGSRSGQTPRSARERAENFAQFRHAVQQPRFAVATLAEEALNGKSTTARGRSLLLESVAALERAAIAAGELAYLTTAQPVLNPAYVRLDAALQSTVDRARADAAAAGLHFEADVAAKFVRVDASVLALTVEAALSNAVNFATSRIRLEANKRGGKIVASIIDDGPGVDPALAARVGEPFLVDWTRSSRDSFRLGLGLAAAVQRAKALGGSLALAPGPEGSGAQCTIECEAEVGA